MNELFELVSRMNQSDLKNILVGEEDDKSLMLEGGNMFDDVVRIH